MLRCRPALLLVAGLVAVRLPPPAVARPEFARREGKACGYCHIGPRGGGARNATGVAYARNDFRLPAPRGDLNDFERDRDREAFLHARKMIDLQHIPAAVAELTKLTRTVDGEAARRLVEEEIHGLNVAGTEMLGQARLYVRGERTEEGVELLVVLESEYGGLDVREQARADLKELARDPALRALLARERREAQARRVWLDARRCELDGEEERAARLDARLRERFPDSRAAALLVTREGD